MKIKVKLFNNKLIINYFAVLSFVSILLSFVSVVIDIPNNLKLPACLLLLFFLISLFLVMWIHANLLNEIRLKINNSTVIVKTGDIFKEDDFKVIAFNEYFDTHVDNKIISEKTLNGIYIKDYVKNVSELDTSIINDNHLKEKVLETNSDRPNGKKPNTNWEQFFNTMITS